MDPLCAGSGFKPGNSFLLFLSFRRAVLALVITSFIYFCRLKLLMQNSRLMNKSQVVIQEKY